MSAQNKKDLYAKALEKWGAANQSLHTVEELVELSAAILRFQEEPTLSNKLEMNSELADVDIMLDQLREMPYYVDKLTLRQLRRKKLIKLQLLLEENDGEQLEKVDLWPTPQVFPLESFTQPVHSLILTVLADLSGFVGLIMRFVIRPTKFDRKQLRECIRYIQEKLTILAFRIGEYDEK